MYRYDMCYGTWSILTSNNNNNISIYMLMLEYKCMYMYMCAMVPGVYWTPCL